MEATEWSLDESLELVRAMNSEIRTLGWFVALAGGVLNNGVSDHDLDLVFVPYDQTEFSAGDIWRYLGDFRGWDLVRTPEQMIASWRSKGLKDTKTVVRWSADGKLVDAIFPCGERSD